MHGGVDRRGVAEASETGEKGARAFGPVAADVEQEQRAAGRRIFLPQLLERARVVTGKGIGEAVASPARLALDHGKGAGILARGGKATRGGFGINAEIAGHGEGKGAIDQV